MNFFTSWFFLLLLSIPLLILIYKLKNKHKIVIVSSLFLWNRNIVSEKGGTIFKRLPLPLLFFIELVIFILITCAAATPFVLSKDQNYPIWIILDDSYSMLAGDKLSAKNKGTEAIIKEVNRINNRTVRFILAGSDLNIIGDKVKSNIELENILSQWKCASTESSLIKAIGFVKQISGDTSNIMIITDHAPKDNKLVSNNLLWHSFGKASSNVAFVNATRTLFDKEERCLFEIVNISANSAKVNFEISYSIKGKEKKSVKKLIFTENEVKKLVIKIPYKSSALSAKITSDSLKIDDEVILLSDTRKPVKVKLDFDNKVLEKLVSKAVKSIDKAIVVNQKFELLFTDKRQSEKQKLSSWIFQFIINEKPTPFIGPFIMDKTHPLMNGISMGGIIWASGKDNNLMGNPIISAGNLALFTDLNKSLEDHHIYFSFNPNYSNLQNSPNWPIFIWNSIEWRMSSLAGIRKVNYRLGENIDIITSKNKINSQGEEIKDFSILKPNNESVDFSKSIEKFRYNPKQIGIYEINDNNKYKFAVNPLSFQESDLSNNITGKWSTWNKDGAMLENYKNVLWIFLFPAFLLLLLHQWIIRKH